MYKPFQITLLRRLIGAGRISERCFDREAGNKGAGTKGRKENIRGRQRERGFVPAREYS